ncbi:MAG TPA: DNA repair protein RecN [Steroidobacteraceae bacterium]|jgi:DNA repair protein RecN (Recombination protein N)|nr:DNA repair protein RecN [Steroidobacteraceae bacterium]
MLTHLQLRDFVLVDSAEFELKSGLTALTGETGAGKSIVVDALLLIAGGRAGGDVVRQGAERAEVAASFDALPSTAKSWLQAQSIEHEGDLVVRRVIGADGRSRAYVNGQMVPIQALRELAEFLIEIHGQQEFQRLVNRGAQRETLDEHLPDRRALGEVSELYERYSACRRELETLKAAAENRDSRLDLLRFQLAELKAEVTTAAAIEELFTDRKRVAGRGRLAEAARTALAAVFESEGDSAGDLLGRAHTALRNAADADPQLLAAAKLVAEAMINTQEAADALRRYLDVLDIDPKRQEEIERQAAALEAMARKHRIGVLELPAQMSRTEAELAALDNAQQSLVALERDLAALAHDYRRAAKRLTEARNSAADHLSRRITELMQALGMAGGRFAVGVAPSESEFGRTGSDDIEFLVGANPGQAPKSLAKVASGGELSRISLAVQVACSQRSSARCMVFDEVDAGIGGAVAEIVGRLLRDLGERTQVLCVTHLAQVASQAHSQFRVTKLSDGKITRTTVKSLAEPERIDEIARMLGGIDIGEQARAHAREMLAHSASPAVLKKKRTPAQRR